MKTLVFGASGATGKHLVEHLLKAGKQVKIIVRFNSRIPDSWLDNENISIIRSDISIVSVEQMSEYLKDCEAAASCLGHNLTLKGIYGKPRRLVRDTVKLICDAILHIRPTKPIKIVLMNTAGNRNRDLDEPISLGQKIVLALLRLMLPPHVDNEQAADHLRLKVGQSNQYVEWAVVRPDTLINEIQVSNYTLHNSPTRSAIFKPGQTSRINVGHFMAKLILDDTTWQMWKGQMPVIYNELQNTGKNGIR
ncbi:MAG TPA: NAD(P)H-binding protein [Bacteroidia bacterium]|nr:NAD(P)H-binding protein [Bacteroidia bacterium]